MAVNKEMYQQIVKELSEKNITLVAVSKTKPVEDILTLYGLGHRDFGENYVQELAGKQQSLPGDIRWHFIGHLQSNKVKYIASFVHLIHGVDSVKLLNEINKQAQKQQRTINVLLQVHIAQEETKFGFDENELKELFRKIKEETEARKYVEIKGLMGMASFTENKEQVRKEFRYLKSLFDQYAGQQPYKNKFEILSMGMSGDYRIAAEEGTTIVRIGSLIFGERS